ncbi:MAG: DUF6603 domain-containing protein, partial [Pseudomonadota bacterium]
QAALAVFDEDAAGQELRLLAVDLETGVDLTTLPLVGPLIREEGHFGLSFQLSHASRALTKADAPLVEAINGRLPQGAIPLPEAEKIPKDLNMLTLLKIGDQTIDLALPIKPGSDGEPEEDHTPAAPPAPTQDGFKWKKLDKTVGPVHLSRVGARYRKTAASEPEVTLALDGGLTMGPVHFSLNGLGLAATLHKAGKPRVSAVPQLDGLGLDYQSGPVQMAGAFQRNGPGDYAGAALLGTEALTLTALGSYVATDEGKSLFVYAVLDRPLGGPAFFFVTGLAAGFGYNRALALPPVKKVARFPLIAQATKPATKTPDLSAGLAELRDAVPVEFGQYFLAVGIKFNSFKLIDSFALLSVQFGRNFEVDLLGLSTAVIPPPDAGKTPVAKVEVALKAVFRPEEGVLRLDAVLTEASFLLSRKCKLRGGFAFYAWFKDQGGHRAGDFVATLGGYHPQYDLKAHPGFPNPPRVSIDWPVSRTVHVKGDLYCALTPGAIMAGGHLSATFHDGAIRAWFKAGVDFIMMWKPFHYDVRVYVDIGGSYTFWFFGEQTITIDIGADLKIWGPEFSGNAHVSLYVVSFNIPFGAGAPPIAPPIPWDAFVKDFLPAPDHWVTASLVQGRQDDQGQVDPQALVIQVDCALPASRLLCGKLTDTATVPLGVGPCNIARGHFTADLTITVEHRNWDGSGLTYVEDQFALTP